MNKPPDGPNRPPPPSRMPNVPGPASPATNPRDQVAVPRVKPVAARAPVLARPLTSRPQPAPIVAPAVPAPEAFKTTDEDIDSALAGLENAAEEAGASSHPEDFQDSTSIMMSPAVLPGMPSPLGQGPETSRAHHVEVGAGAANPLSVLAQLPPNIIAQLPPNVLAQMIQAGVQQQQPPARGGPPFAQQPQPQPGFSPQYPQGHAHVPPARDSSPHPNFAPHSQRGPAPSANWQQQPAPPGFHGPQSSHVPAPPPSQGGGGWQQRQAPSPQGHATEAAWRPDARPVPTGPTMVSLKSVKKAYKRGSESLTILDELSLDIPKGAFLALMGPSGSGKSTLLNLIAGLDRPTSGSIDIDGKQISSMSEAELARWRSESVGFIFQSYNLIPVLNALQNVELPLLLTKLSSKERKQRAQTALRIVGLEDRMTHYPRQLSGGQEQRVAIARAIVNDPVLLVGDEPTGDLDRKSADEILHLLEKLNRELGKTIVMVTHDPAAANRAQMLRRLDKGALV